VTVVRRAEPSDAAGLSALLAEVAREPEGWLLEVGVVRDAAAERRYLRAVRRHPDAAVFVAVDGERVVGRLSLARDPHPASRHVADLGLMVARSHRRRGIGRLLLAQAVAWAGEAAVSKLELHVFPWNAPAIALYDDFGFVREGLRAGHFRRGEAEVDVLLMAYRLGAAEHGPTPSGG
jgi:putative acetyltransferase